MSGRTAFVILIFVAVLLVTPFCARAQNPAEPPATQNSSTAAPRGSSENVLEISIEEAIELAITYNLDIQLELQTQQRTREEIAIAGAVFDPLFSTRFTHAKFRSPTVDTLSGVGGGGLITVVTVNPFVSQTFEVGLSGRFKSGTTYSLTIRDDRGDSPESSFFGINPRNQTSIRADLTQPLLKDFGFESNLTALKQAENTTLIAEHGVRRMIENTVQSVHNAYWDLQLKIEDLRVKRENLREAGELLEINKQRVNVGSAKEIDVIDAEANIETQRGGIIEAENALEKSEDTLLDLLNYRRVLKGSAREATAAAYESVRVSPTSRFEPQPVTLDPDEEVALALSTRRDLVQARLELKNSQLNLSNRKNQRKPRLDLSGSWTQGGLEESVGNSFDELFSGRFYDWTFGVTFEIPLGNKSERGLYQQAKRDLQSQILRVEQLENSIILEVTSAIRDIRSAYQKIQTTKAASRLRSEQLQGEQERLRVGASTSYQVLQVQNDLLEAQVEEVRALVEYKLALVAFENATGRILVSP